MKTALLTSALALAMALTPIMASAGTVVEETRVIDTGAAQDPAVLEAVKIRITRDLQQKLADLGYDVGAIDGVYTPKTAAAVSKYQKDKGQTVTGEADDNLFKELGVDTTIYNTHRIEERRIMRYDLATKGSENANVYDDPNADRTGSVGFKQRNKRLSQQDDAAVPESTAPAAPALNR